MEPQREEKSNHCGQTNVQHYHLKKNLLSPESVSQFLVRIIHRPHRGRPTQGPFLRYEAVPVKTVDGEVCGSSRGTGTLFVERHIHVEFSLKLH